MQFKRIKELNSIQGNCLAAGPGVAFRHAWSSSKAITLLVALLVLCLFPASAYADGGFPIIGVLHAGSNPEGIAVDTQTHMVYIAYEYPGLVVGFDPSSGKVRWHTNLGDTPTDVQVDSTNHHVYVTSALYRGKTS